jgi:hypothetical protein
MLAIITFDTRPIEGTGKGDIRGQVRFVAGLFNVAARTEVTLSIFVSQVIFATQP